MHGQIKLGGTALDMTFGNQGKMLDAGNVINGGSVSVQADGKILTITDSFNQTMPARISRFNTDGSIDLSFGNNGRVLLHDPAINGYYGNIEFQADGKILVFGSMYLNGYFTSVFLIKRLNYDGSLDVSFGNNGYVTTNFSNAENFRNEIADLLVQPDGKIVAVGLTATEDTNSPDWDLDTSFALARYLPDGSPDLSFGNGGKVIVETHPRFFTSSNCGSVRYGYDVPRQALLQSDGKIVVAGITQSPSFNVNGCYSNLPDTGLAASSFTVMRFNDNGTLDSGFNNSGMLIVQSPLPLENPWIKGQYVNDAYKISSQPNGKFLVSGYIYNSDPNLDRSGTFRINADGSFDPTFAENGLFKNWDIEVLSNGKIITKYTIGIEYGNPCLLERYSENGTFETILNTFLPTIPTARQISLTCEDVAIQSDDKIIVLGKNKIYDSYAGTLGLMRLFSDSVQLKSGK
jgi:uncharacterized delta-60 repeat protein